MGVKVAFLSEEPLGRRLRTRIKRLAAKAIIPKSAVHGEVSASYVFAVRDGKLERAPSAWAGDGRRCRSDSWRKCWR